MDDIVVFRTWNEPEADMAVGLLKAEGIDAWKRDSGLRSSIAITMDGLGQIEILTLEENAERASEIISARFSSEKGEDALPEEE